MGARTVVFGAPAPRRRVLALGAVGPMLASVLLVLRLDTVVTNLRSGLWFVMILVGLVLAGYAGWARGGALAAWAVVGLSILWSYVVPPLVAHLQGDGIGERSYAVLRPSVVGLPPYRELLTGLRLGPIVAVLFAGVFGTWAFGLGAVLRWGAETRERR